MKTGYSVADAMSTRPVTVPSSLTVREASKVMRDRDIGSLLVMEDLVLVGILTAEDVVARVAAIGASPELPVGQIMSTDIVDISPEADIYEAMVVMREHDVLHLPVRDVQEKRLLGYLTFKDVLRIEPQLFELMEEKAELAGHDRKTPERREGYCEECGNYATELTRRREKLLCQYCAEY